MKKILSNMKLFLGRSVLGRKMLKSFRVSPVYMGNSAALVQTGYGNYMFVNTRDLSLSPQLIMEGFWEPGITNFYLNILKKNLRVLEIGTNIGWYSILAARKIGPGGKLFLFEANPEVIATLQSNMEINGFLDRVEIFNKAVFNENKKISFNVFSRHQGSSTIGKLPQDIIKYWNWKDSFKKIEIDAVKIDDELKINNIDLIKIDAEGSEPYIFEGMEKLLKNNKNIQILCEFYPSNIINSGKSPEEFLDLLTKKYKLKLHVIDDHARAIPCSKNEILKNRDCEIYLTK